MRHTNLSSRALFAVVVMFALGSGMPAFGSSPAPPKAAEGPTSGLISVRVAADPAATVDRSYSDIRSGGSGPAGAFFVGGPIYTPDGEVRAPNGNRDTVGYVLRPIEELDNITTLVNGRMAGNEGPRNNAVRLPSNRGVSTPGIANGGWFNDPAGAVARLFYLNSSFGTTYTGKAQGVVGRLSGM